VCDEFFLVNPEILNGTEAGEGNSSNAEDIDVKLHENDWLWMEIAQTSQSLRSKLLQLERAYRHFDTTEKNNHLPRVAVVCLNGERAIFTKAVEHIRGLITQGALPGWVRVIFPKIPM